MFDIAHAKRKLKKDGWSYRRAAPVLGCSYQWLSVVLNGRQVSAPLLEAIANLPTYHEWRKAHGQGE